MDLKVPNLTGGFLGASSISEADRKRENWIKTDTECKSRCYIYRLLNTKNTICFFSFLSLEFSYHLLAFCRSCSGAVKINTHCNKPPLMFQAKLSPIKSIYNIQKIRIFYCVVKGVMYSILRQCKRSSCMKSTVPEFK